MRGLVFIGVLLSIALTGCIKAPTYSDIPHIEFKSVSSSSVAIGALDTFTISFTDGDGDLFAEGTGDSSDFCGLKHGDSSYLKQQGFNVFMINTRDSCFETPFATPDLRPSGTYKSLNGDMLILKNVNSYYCSDCGNVPCNVHAPNNPYGLDTVIYIVYVRDQAGHLSNGIKTDPVIVGCAH